MKKLFCFLTILVLLLSAGCAKKNDILTGSDGIIENTVDTPIFGEQEEIDIVENPNDSSNSDEPVEVDTPEVKGEENNSEAEKGETETDNKEPATPEPESQQKKRTVEQMIAEDHPELQAYFDEFSKGRDDIIIIQAKRNGESVVVASDQLPTRYMGSTRMPLEVTKVYYGSVKVGDVISYWDFYGTYHVAGDLVYTVTGLDILPLEENTEYLMCLEKDQLYSDIFYRILPTECGYYSYVPIEEREAIAQRVKDGTATKYDQFHHALFEGLVE